MGEFLIAAQGGRRSTFCPMLMKFIRKAYQHLLAGMPTGHQTMTGRSSLCRVTVSGVTSSSAHSSGC